MLTYDRCRTTPLQTPSSRAASKPGRTWMITSVKRRPALIEGRAKRCRAAPVRPKGGPLGTHFTCFTSTKVRILTSKLVSAEVARAGGMPLRARGNGRRGITMTNRTGRGWRRRRRRRRRRRKGRGRRALRRARGVRVRRERGARAGSATIAWGLQLPVHGA
jgi:hypothetical protein